MDVIKSFNDDIKNIFKSKDVNLDNWSFKLFYRVTYGLLILASALVFATQYVGDPIECAYDGEVTNKVFEKKCWIHGAEKLAGPGTNEPDREYQKRYDCLIKVSFLGCAAILAAAQPLNPGKLLSCRLVVLSSVSSIYNNCWS